jgi:hypothetical protein
MIGRLWARFGWPVILPVLAGSIALLAGIVAAAGGQPPKGPPVAPEWKVPELPAGAFQKSARAVAAKGLWGTAAPPPGAPGAGVVEKAPLTPPDWRIIGMAINGPTRVVFVQVGKEPFMELSIGDKLPGGAEIKGIEPGRLLLLVDGKRRVLALDER